MCSAGIECDAVTCCSLITALDKGGQWQVAEQVSDISDREANWPCKFVDCNLQ